MNPTKICIFTSLDFSKCFTFLLSIESKKANTKKKYLKLRYLNIKPRFVIYIIEQLLIIDSLSFPF